MCVLEEDEINLQEPISWRTMWLEGQLCYGRSTRWALSCLVRKVDPVLTEPCLAEREMQGWAREELPGTERG